MCACAATGELWDYQFCTEMFQPMSRSGVLDAFFEQTFDEKAVVAECLRKWGVTSRPYWAAVSYGGHEPNPNPSLTPGFRCPARLKRENQSIATPQA